MVQEKISFCQPDSALRGNLGSLRTLHTFANHTSPLTDRNLHQSAIIANQQNSQIMIESFLISIATNLITGVGQSAFKKIIKDDSLENEIRKAFNNALNTWSINHGIKEREKIFTKSRFAILIECVKNPKKIKELDKGTTDIINLFKLELQKSTTAWNHVQDVQFQTTFNKLNSIDQHINALTSDLTKQIKAIEKTFDDALISYKDAFKHQLDYENKDLPNHFHNTFIGRITDLESIDYLIRLSDYRIITIVADGGYGKTRTCVEYFKQFIETDDTYEAFVLNTNAVKSLNFSTQFQNEKNIIVLIDDAHKNPKILNDVVNATSRYENVKIMMTIRRVLYDDTIAEIATHNRNIGLHTIKRLSYEETQELFKSQLPGLKEIELKKLADKSKGIPIVVLGLCQVAINGKYESELSEEYNFKLFVKELKTQVINDIHSKYLIEKEKVNKTIELLSFFSPLKNRSEEILEFSKLNGIETDETNLIFDYLEEYDFLSKGNEIYIKPDPYSDTILLDSSTRIKYLLRKDIKLFLDRLIRNLVEVEQSERLDLSIDNLLLDFISSFKNKSTESSEDRKVLESNLDTLKSFTFKKPQICFLAVEHLISSQQENDEFWEEDKDFHIYSNPFKTIHESIETILSIVALNTHKISEFDSLYNLLILYHYENSKTARRILERAWSQTQNHQSLLENRPKGNGKVDEDGPITGFKNRGWPISTHPLPIAND